MTPDNLDWLELCEVRPVGTQIGSDLVIAWNAARRLPLRPHPFVYFAHLAPDGDGFALVATRHLWNPNFAFAKPWLATLSGRVAFNCAFGGGKKVFPAPLIGFVELPFTKSSKFFQAVPATSDAGTTRWGDFVTVRPWYRRRGADRLAATTYTVNLDAKSDSGRDYIPRFFGFE